MSKAHRIHSIYFHCWQFVWYIFTVEQCYLQSVNSKQQMFASYIIQLAFSERLHKQKKTILTFNFTMNALLYWMQQQANYMIFAQTNSQIWFRTMHTHLYINRWDCEKKEWIFIKHYLMIKCNTQKNIG